MPLTLSQIEDFTAQEITYKAFLAHLLQKILEREENPPAAMDAAMNSVQAQIAISKFPAGIDADRVRAKADAHALSIMGRISIKKNL